MSFSYLLILTGVCSVLAWSGLSSWLIPLSLVLPCALGRATTRRQAGLVALAYFAAALWPVIPASRMLYGAVTPAIGHIALWVTCSLFLSAHFWVFWSENTGRRGLLIFLALIVQASLPIGVASPFISAGILFPALRWPGLINILLIVLQLSYPFITHRIRGINLRLPVLIWPSLALLSNLLYIPPPPPAGWKTVDTLFASTRNDFAHLKWVESYAVTHEGSVFIFPESVLHSWPGQPRPWLDVDTLAAAHKTIAFGAQARQGSQTVNALFFHGQYSGMYVQRNPVPIAMARFSGDPFGPAIVEIGGVRAAVLVCYEQLLVTPVLLSAAQDPAVIVAASNLTWVRGTPIAAVQRISIEAWGRLFRLPVVRAVNQ